VSSGKVQEDPAGEGELAGLDDAGEQPVTARPQVAQPGDDGVLFGAGDLPERPGQGVGHSHAEGPERPIADGLAVGVDEAGGLTEPLTVVHGAAQHDRVDAIEASGRAGGLIGGFVTAFTQALGDAAGDLRGRTVGGCVDNQDAHDHHLVAPPSAGAAWTARAVGPW